jgi:integrase
MTRTPHIIRTRKPYQSFLFRCIIPKDLISVFRQVEFRVSLGNSMYSHSKIISTNLYNLCQFIFREVREGNMHDITLEDVKNILRIEVRKSLLHIHHYQYGTNVFSKDKLNDSISRSMKEEERLRGRLEKDYKGTIDLIEREIDKILITQNLEPNKRNVEYKGLVRRWIDLKLIRQNWKRDVLNESGKTDDDFRNELEDKWKLGLWESGEDKKLNLSPVIENYAPEPIEPYIVQLKSIEQKYNKIQSSPSPLFSKVIQEFYERMKINKRRTKTIGASKDAFNQLIEIIGDKPIGDYTNADARDYRSTLSKLPKNRNKMVEYRDKTLNEILSMDVPMKDRISQQTEKLINSKISGFFNYCLDEYPDFVGKNVFRKHYLQSSSVKLKDKKESFTDEDLHLIFNPKTYLPAIFENPLSKIKYPYFFIPILSVFTGCRLEELCMMRVKDIVKINGVWVYHIREEGEYGNEETKVKNPYSERTIPLHPVLIDILGFIKYVKMIEKIGHNRVFHELTKIGSGRFQQNVGKFFNDRYLKKIGLKDGVRKVSFHSFRHSVETHLTNQNVNPRFIDYLQGHSSKDTGANIYMKGIKADVLLKECVSKIDWGIDWEKLKVKF